MPSNPKKKLKLGAILGHHGAHLASWRHPLVNPADAGTLAYWQKLARICEAGRMDYLFVADTNRVQYLRNPQVMSQMSATTVFEPVTLLSALAASTEHLGLVGTMTTTYNQPYHVARLFSSLDHLSGGRASWNVVTSSSSEEAPNFVADKHLGHDDRYGRAREFLDVVLGLWDSWEDDAFIHDQEAGVFLDPGKMHYLNHQGERFSVRGPLNSPRTPQGRPLIFQAGSSDIGRQFGAEKADALFTAQETLPAAQAFYADVKNRAARCGRDPDDLLIFVGVGPIVGHSLAEAQGKLDLLQSRLAPDVALLLLSEVLASDVTHMSPDQLVKDLPPSDGMQSRRDLLLAKAIEEKMTLLELSRFVAGGRGHRQLIGTPQSIADDLELWLEAGACDGFLIQAPYLPGGLEDFVQLVVPLLQERGIYRTEYEGKTLRENLGLRKPVHPARR
jgi:FMN-dependent oxidoreductase (nitrilotriacetate monooxygenase family)